LLCLKIDTPGLTETTLEPLHEVNEVDDSAVESKLLVDMRVNPILDLYVTAV
jgi:hypothetical protein